MEHELDRTKFSSRTRSSNVLNEESVIVMQDHAIFLAKRAQL